MIGKVTIYFQFYLEYLLIFSKRLYCLKIVRLEGEMETKKIIQLALLIAFHWRREFLKTTCKSTCKPSINKSYIQWRTIDLSDNILYKCYHFYSELCCRMSFLLCSAVKLYIREIPKNVTYSDVTEERLRVSRAPCILGVKKED